MLDHYPGHGTNQYHLCSELDVQDRFVVDLPLQILVDGSKQHHSDAHLFIGTIMVLLMLMDGYHLVGIS
jgi:hypothetical protein